jgi:hypothetical protein
MTIAVASSIRLVTGVHLFAGSLTIGVATDDVIVGEDGVEADAFDGLGDLTKDPGIVSDIGVDEHHAKFHARFHFLERS